MAVLASILLSILSLPEPSDNKDISTNKSSNTLEETLNLKSKKKKTILENDKNKSFEKRILEKIK